MRLWAAQAGPASIIAEKLGLITKYVNYSATKTTLNMIQVLKDEKDKYFLDHQNSDTGLSFQSFFSQYKMILMTYIKY